VSLLWQSLLRGVAARDSVVLTRGAGYRLDPSRVWIDVAHFDDLVGQAATAPAELALARYCEALALVTGEICESERTTPWIIEARDRYHERVRRAATAAGRLALRQGHAELAADFGRRACELDPLAEEGWQILIEAHWRAERRTEALRSFSSVRALLHRELGVLPGRALQQLYTEVLRDEQVFQVA
jgi:DNA-binding SARP family transcriptional activator